MDILQLANVLAQVSPVPGIAIAVSVVQQIYNTCNAVHDKQTECMELANTCVQVIVKMSENVGHLQGSRLQEAVDQVISVLQRVLNKTRTWLDKHFFAKLMFNGAFFREVASLKNELNLCMTMFTNSGIIEIVRTQELVTGLLMQLLAKQNNQTELLEQIRHQQIPREDSRKLMASVQRTLWEPSNQHVKQDLGAGLYSVCAAVGTLPPFADLSGQLERLDGAAVAGGTSSDIWRGVWLGKRTVAIKCLRAHRATKARMQRFEAEAQTWRALRHQNVLQFFGIAVDQGPSVALISPWMTNEDAFTFIGKDENCDRRKILRGAARGLNYLHHKNIVHGDIRASKILVDDEGDAKLCDFGLSIMGGDSGSQSMVSTVARWTAPELISGDSAATSASDVFSYGRTVLEIFSGKRPFAEEGGRYFRIVNKVINGDVPERPMDEETFERGLSDQVWELCKWTWKYEAHERPRMDDVVHMTEEDMITPY